jgi:hypothetical protein
MNSSAPSPAIDRLIDLLVEVVVREINEENQNPIIITDRTSCPAAREDFEKGGTTS